MKTKRITALTALLISSLVVAITSVSALDISGSYDDKGTAIGSTFGDSETISFHGILSLDFDPIMAEAKYGDTTHIDLIDRDRNARQRSHEWFVPPHSGQIQRRTSGSIDPP